MLCLWRQDSEILSWDSEILSWKGWWPTNPPLLRSGFETRVGSPSDRVLLNILLAAPSPYYRSLSDLGDYFISALSIIVVVVVVIIISTNFIFNFPKCYFTSSFKRPLLNMTEIRYVMCYRYDWNPVCGVANTIWWKSDVWCVTNMIWNLKSDIWCYQYDWNPICGMLAI